MSTAIAETAAAAYVRPIDLDWDNVDEVAGNDLLTKESLISVPFGITSATFRAGVKDSDYVSVEAVILGKPRTMDMPEGMHIGDTVVFNDGSTGIRRQVVEYLTGKGLIPAPKDGPDAPLISVADPVRVFSIMLKARRGLRVSKYDNEYKADNQTFYLA